MSRGNKQIEGQLTFEMCLNTENFVCQSNALVGGKQALKLNSAKLVRAAIMQIKPDDKEILPYKITIQDLAGLLNVSPTNIYRDINEITDDIINNPVYIRETNEKRVRWVKIPWVTICTYDSDVGVAIKLNDELKPFLLNLKEHYTQYELAEVLAMKSVYAIRIFEMLQEKIKVRHLPSDGIDVEMSIREIRECCDCEDKYEKFSHLKSRVIDAAVNEIERTTYYTMSYDYVKKGKSVIGFIFHLRRDWTKMLKEG